MSLFKALVFVLTTDSANQAPPVQIGPFASQTQCVEAARVILGPNVREITSSDDIVSGVITVDVPKNTLAGGTYTYEFKRSVHCYEVSGVAH